MGNVNFLILFQLTGRVINQPFFKRTTMKKLNVLEEITIEEKIHHNWQIDNFQDNYKIKKVESSVIKYPTLPQGLSTDYFLP